VSTVYRRGGFVKTLDTLGYGDASDIVFISVDAEREPNFRLDTSPTTPTLSEVSRAIGVVLIQSSFEATLLAEESAKQWYEELIKRRGPGAPDLNFYFIEVSLRNVHDPAERTRFMDIPTAFTLPRKDVDDLRSLARRLLAESPQYQALMMNLQAGAASAPIK
jgi:NTE family protein